MATILEDLGSLLESFDDAGKLFSRLNQLDVETADLYEVAKGLELSDALADACMRLFTFVLGEISAKTSVEASLSELKERYPEAASKDGSRNCFDFILDQIRCSPEIVRALKTAINSDVPNWIASTKIICDIRPIFSVDRCEILAMQCVSQLRVEPKNDHVKLFELDEDCLKELRDQCELALKKIGIIKLQYGARQ